MNMDSLMLFTKFFGLYARNKNQVKYVDFDNKFNQGTNVY